MMKISSSRLRFVREIWIGKSRHRRTSVRATVKKHLIHYAIAVIAGAVLQHIPCYQAAAGESPTVMILNSYHQGYTWSDAEISGVLGRLREGYPLIEPAIEHLDDKRQSGHDQHERNRDYLTDKYRMIKVDLIVVLDNQALDMIVRYRKTFFPNVPVVFAGVNDFSPPMLAGRKGITGVAELLDIQGTLETALSLHPRTGEVFVIHDQTVSGIALRREMESVAKKFQDRVAIRYLPPVTFEEAELHMRSLPANALGLILTYTTDRRGKSLSLDESTRRLTSISPVPVYATHVTRLGHGIVGGHLLEGTEHGRRAADLALRVLKGEDAARIPVDTKGISPPMFDYLVLEKFGISLKDLPPDSVVVNRPDFLYDRHRNIVLGTLAVLALLLSVIGYLIASIVNRKRAEESLRRSEEQFKAMFETVSIGMAQTDPRTAQWLRVNQKMCEITGYSSAEMLAMRVPEITHPEDRGRDWESFQQVVRGEAPNYRIEKRYLRKDGRVVWVNVNMTVIHDPAGLPMRTMAAIEDITERKQAEEALRASQELERSILQSVPHGLFGVEHRRIFFANDAMEDIFGWKPEELIGQSTRVIFRTDQEWGKYGVMLYSQLERQSVFVTESDTPFIRKDGREIFCRMSVSRTGKELGASRKIVATFEDITERKRMEEALKQSEKRFRMVVESAPDAIFVRSVSGHFVYLNHAAVGLFGAASADGLIGTHITERIQPDGHAISAERIKLLNEGQAVPAIEQTFLRMDGSPFTVEVSAVPLRYEGTNGALVFARDISERKRAEEESRALQERLQRAEKMEALGVLAGGVAHDLNNVLGILVGYAELLAEDIDKKSPLRPHVEYIRQGGERAAAIVHDLLTLARRGVQTSEIVDLNSIIDDFQNSPEFEKICSFYPNVRIETALASGLLNIKGSPVHLHKTVMNLVANAAEAMPAGGKVTIATSNRHLDRPVPGHDDIQEGDYVVLSVTDTGEGISERDLKRIFEPFFTKKVMGRSGTGLGLSVVWGTVKDHKGYINVQSEEGKGTMFTLSFPVTREEKSKEQTSVSISEYLGHGESVLVVDDVQGQRELAARMLEKLNYSVAAVASGEEAVEYLRTHKADLVVLDMIMNPGMDGLDTFKKILELHPGQKAIIVSGFSESDRVRAAQALGVGAYVRKPYVREILGTAVKKELDRAA